MDIALALDYLIPSGNWQGSVTDNTEKSFNSIQWHDHRVKPTWQEIQDTWTDRALIRENNSLLKEKQEELHLKALELFEFCFTLFQTLKNKRIISEDDFEPELRMKVANWKNLLDEIESRELAGKL
jgi:hypothetical protein